jgi:hypothetical protein
MKKFEYIGTTTLSIQEKLVGYKDAVELDTTDETVNVLIAKGLLIEITKKIKP